MPKRSDLERFEALTTPEPNTGCLLWVGAHDDDGYGKFWFMGKPRPASHAAFALLHGRLPRGIARHRCDFPPCADGTHILEGTTIDNRRDADERGRSIRGERNWRASLTDDQAREVYRRRVAGESGRKLAAEFGINEATVCRIFRRKKWRHIHGTDVATEG